ncbi:hypothetical protein KEM55_003874 [Ascosphaera atra]|nr:hypothetical protein KEM55_003874 [Ascosphaera atra]
MDSSLTPALALPAFLSSKGLRRGGQGMAKRGIDKQEGLPGYVAVAFQGSSAGPTLATSKIDDVTQIGLEVYFVPSTPWNEHHNDWGTLAQAS